jgi:two-component system NtrC family sensor kinase
MPKSLGVKLVLCVGAVLLVETVAFSLAAIYVQRAQFREQAREDGDRLIETMKRATRDDMFRADQEGVQRTIDTLASTEGVNKISIMDKEGTVVASSVRADIGTVLDKQEGACVACHHGQEALEEVTLQERCTIVERAGEERALAMFSPIYNAPDCFGAPCHVHDSEDRVLGVIEVLLSLSTGEALARRTYRSTVGFSAVTFGALALTIGALIHRFVTRPVRALVSGTRMIAIGDLGHRIEVKSSDEVADLAHSFNQMAESLAKSRARLERWQEELEGRVAEATSELATVNARLQTANESLREADEIKSEFMRKAAHELRSPMAAIQSCLKVVVDEIAPRDKQRDMVLRAERRTRELLRMINKLLALSRLKAAQPRDDMRPLGLAAPLRTTVELMRPAAAERRIELHEEVPAELPLVRGCEEDIVELFTNLVGNAIKYSGEGGVVRIAAQASNASIKVSVSDEGIGISAEDLPHVFDEFYRGERARNFVREGTGLGLSVVAEVVQSHGAEVCVDSEVGKGTTFTVTFPAPDSPTRDDG